MKITICIGSSCHLKGSRQVVEKLQSLVEEKGLGDKVEVVEQLQNLIAEHNLGDKVELGATFCLGKCQQGVCVMVDEEFFSVSPDTVDEFFAANVLAKI